MTIDQETTSLVTDVLVIGSGAAGMSAALAAASAGAAVLLIDRSLIGRGGATVMAQMTVAAALGEEVPDAAEHHLADTLQAGRGLCDERLAAIVCERGPGELRRLDGWGVGWARHDDGRIRQAHAPGHDRPRCAYVDFLSSGPAISKTLRAQVQRQSSIRRIGDLCITDLVVTDGAIRGAVGFSLQDGQPVVITAPSVIIATGGLTRLYRRNSASLNMAGDGYALALRAGASLIDMEFVQFFPIGHLAPRLIGMDPIMWDPFRYKLGGRLLNGEDEEFLDRYGEGAGGRYVTTRDLATYAIMKEVEAGRGTPSGGAYLSFEHVPEAALREAFGPVIDRLAANGIDLTQRPVEVAPIAHYHMGGVRVGPSMETDVTGLYAAGEAVGGSNGANRLSGNAVTEGLVFGREAGTNAAAHSHSTTGRASAFDGATEALDLLGSHQPDAALPGALFAELQATMSDDVGPFRTEAGLLRALDTLARIRTEAGDRPSGSIGHWPVQRLDWFDLRNALVVADCVVRSALRRTESRGAHQREDFPSLSADWTRNLVLRRGSHGLDMRTTKVGDHADAFGSP
ncbi:FAD-binding protein [Beijerinckia sp. L45]|uniref:FAD-binding protein n=1 Tax=Beijerinckia sp. L45 TaxID=1641855 RepID=UPI00131A7BEC|nr:FAD-binding protein [Beijerinckia sp. L45]